MSEKITLEMTREQARAVMNATELPARLEIGQFNRITEQMMDRFISDDDKFDGTRRDIVNGLLKQACRTMFGVDAYGWPDVGEKSLTHERCWAVYATIRHALAWHDQPEGNPWSVAFDKPMGYGEKMPVCRIEEDGT